MVNRNPLSATTSSSSSSSSSSSRANRAPPPSPPLPVTTQATAGQPALVTPEAVGSATPASNPSQATPSAVPAPLTDDPQASQPTSSDSQSSSSINTPASQGVWRTPRMSCPPKAIRNANGTFSCPTSNENAGNEDDESEETSDDGSEPESDVLSMPTEMLNIMKEMDFTFETVECLSALGINSPEKLFALEELELRNTCHVSFLSC